MGNYQFNAFFGSKKNTYLAAVVNEACFLGPGSAVLHSTTPAVLGSKPGGSATTVSLGSGATAGTATFTPDTAGDYVLTINYALGGSSTLTVRAFDSADLANIRAPRFGTRSTARTMDILNAAVRAGAVATSADFGGCDWSKFGWSMSEH